MQASSALVAGAIILAVGEGPPGRTEVLLSVAGGITGAMALGAFYRALAIGTMSIVAPISASGVAVPVLVGVATGDRPSAVQAVGLAVTVAGVLLASREPASSADAARAGRLSIGLALVAAVGIGTYFVITDTVADESVLWLLFLGRLAATPLILGAILAMRAPVVARGRDAGQIVLIGQLDLAATGLYALANTKGLLSVVAVVGSLYPVVTVLLARAVLSERLHRSQAAGVALAFAGVALVAAG